MVSHTRHPIRLSVALHLSFLTGTPRRRRPDRCSPFHAPIPPASSGVRRRGEAVIPRPTIRGPMAVVLPRSCSPYPHTPAVLGAPLPAMLIVRRQRWGPVIGRERRRVRPAIAPSPRSPTAEAQAADHSLITSVRLSARAFLHQTA